MQSDTTFCDVGSMRFAYGETAPKWQPLYQEETMESKKVECAMQAEGGGDVEKKTRERPKVVVWHGLNYLINKIVRLKDGRFRTRVALCYPGEEKGQLEKRTIDATTHQEAERKKQQTIRDLAREHMAELFQMIRDGQFLDAPFGLYRELRYERVRIKKRWAGKAEEYDAIWNRRLKRRFETIPIRELAFFSRTKQEMDILFNHAGHRKISEEEQKCWIQLSDFFDAMSEDGLIPENPIWEYATRYKHSMTGDILHNLSARSLSRKELLSFAGICLRMEESSLGTCMLLRVLLGATIYEVCGLNMDSWVHWRDLSWLEIEREYYQKRGEEPLMKTMLGSANQYRRIGCSDVVERILARHVRSRKAEGATATDAMFVVEGERLRPQMLKDKENELLDQSMDAGMHIAIEGRGRPHRESRDRARTDILRGTAVYNFSYTSEMTPSQIALMCGVDRVRTYAIFYVDWNNLELIRFMKEKLAIWHAGVFQMAGKSGELEVETQKQSGIRKGVLVHRKSDERRHYHFTGSKRC